MRLGYRLHHLFGGATGGDQSNARNDFHRLVHDFTLLADGDGKRVAVLLRPFVGDFYVIAEEFRKNL